MRTASDLAFARVQESHPAHLPAAHAAQTRPSADPARQLCVLSASHFGCLQHNGTLTAAACCLSSACGCCVWFCCLQGIQLRGMQRDSTWNGAAEQYETLFEWALMDQPYAK